MLKSRVKEEDLKAVGEAYFKLLTIIDWNDKVLTGGLREGLNKFLSNALLNRYRVNKYSYGDLYSRSAARKLEANDRTALVFEHAVPKHQYIQSKCEELAKKGKLTPRYVHDTLKKYWKIVVITKDEDRRLQAAGLRRCMPSDWDGVDMLARYKKCSPPIDFSD